MTAAVFFGCAFIAFGPALALYVFTIATDPLRVIFLIAGAFFWLVSLLLSSVFWFLVRVITDNRDGPVQNYLLIFGVLLSVCIQELFRLAYYKLLKELKNLGSSMRKREGGTRMSAATEENTTESQYIGDKDLRLWEVQNSKRKASEGLKSINPEETAPSMRLLAYVSGLGFGIMSGVFSFVNTLSNSLGPGTVGIHGDSPQFFLNSAFMTLVVIMLHVFWGVVFFDGCEKNKWYTLLTVLLTHLVVSTQTFLSPYYEVNLVTAYIIMVLMGIWAFYVAGGSCRSLKLCLLCQDKDFLLYNQRSR
ncbi:gamma-secretase subunit APH-1B isoform X1 [Mus musculus]|uniref:gamma-secretase subunit APH-1B isoform X1 n=1 Tax=Mus musculus TaxID=10090 RepID=UPI0003D77BE1|nr:gamma-secretase subunit APH-1B isoform X1 [Mus musculus]|eukprot:XP_006510985.1 PREDICTED: gamma-secretase subunit APH-1B isoform X1 [Mus musculus]